MAFVVVLHFFSKGELLTSVVDEFTLSSHMVWFVEAFVIVAVNSYVILTGYFMCTARFHASKIITLVLQTMFYTTIVPVCLVFLGVIEPVGIDLYTLLQALIPIHMQQYWFISTYILLLLLSPILNRAITAFNQKQLGAVTMILLIYESVVKSLLPVKLTEDTYGYGIVWFLVLYLTAAYIRLYGLAWFSSLKKSMMIYTISAVVIYVVMIIIRFIYLTFDILGDSIGYSYHYNFIVNYVASIAFFYIFYYMKVKEGLLTSIIRWISPYVLGIYLFHEQIYVRYVWPSWILIEHATSPLSILAIMFCAIFSMMALGVFIDYVRSNMFKFIGKILHVTTIPKWITVLDDFVNGV